MYKKSIRYDSKGGQIFPPQKHELIHNQQLNKNGKIGGKTGGRKQNKKEGRKQYREEGRRQNRKEAKQEGRTDGGRVWNNEKKEDERIWYPPTKFLTAHL